MITDFSALVTCYCITTLQPKHLVASNNMFFIDHRSMNEHFCWVSVGLPRCLLGLLRLQKIGWSRMLSCSFPVVSCLLGECGDHWVTYLLFSSMLGWDCLLGSVRVPRLHMETQNLLGERKLTVTWCYYIDCSKSWHFNILILIEYLRTKD